MQGLLVKVVSTRYTDACFVGISRSTSADIEGFQQWAALHDHSRTHMRKGGSDEGQMEVVVEKGNDLHMAAVSTSGSAAADWPP